MNPYKKIGLSHGWTRCWFWFGRIVRCTDERSYWTWKGLCEDRTRRGFRFYEINEEVVVDA